MVLFSKFKKEGNIVLIAKRIGLLALALLAGAVTVINLDAFLYQQGVMPPDAPLVQGDFIGSMVTLGNVLWAFGAAVFCLYWARRVSMGTHGSMRTYGRR